MCRPSILSFLCVANKELVVGFNPISTREEFFALSMKVRALCSLRFHFRQSN
jgi:hypothetical protein